MRVGPGVYVCAFIVVAQMYHLKLPRTRYTSKGRCKRAWNTQHPCVLDPVTLYICCVLRRGPPALEPLLVRMLPKILGLAAGNSLLPGRGEICTCSGMEQGQQL